MALGLLNLYNAVMCAVCVSKHLNMHECTLQAHKPAINISLHVQSTSLNLSNNKAKTNVKKISQKVPQLNMHFMDITHCTKSNAKQYEIS